ncbi:MAG: STAS domain-containing protein [Planctomycetes bacterium]|nr:STAS domain-containing protein [Planctomycetota bacterium]
MEIEEHNYGAVAVIKPIGALTVADADSLKAQMLDVRTKSLGRIVLDVTAVPFVDSRGLEVLVEVAREMTRTGQTLKLAGLTEVLDEVLKLTGLNSSFEYFEDVNAAVRSFL